jgi:hypothetical protein
MVWTPPLKKFDTMQTKIEAINAELNPLGPKSEAVRTSNGDAMIKTRRRDCSNVTTVEEPATWHVIVRRLRRT